MQDEKQRDIGMSKIGRGIIEVARGHGVGTKPVHNIASRDARIESVNASAVDICDAITGSMPEVYNNKDQITVLKHVASMIVSEQLDYFALVELQTTMHVAMERQQRIASGGQA